MALRSRVPFGRSSADHLKVNIATPLSCTTSHTMSKRGRGGKSIGCFTTRCAAAESAWSKPKRCITPCIGTAIIGAIPFAAQSRRSRASSRLPRSEQPPSIPVKLTRFKSGSRTTIQVSIKSKRARPSHRVERNHMMRERRALPFHLLTQMNKLPSILCAKS